ncbi:E3 ubiquitin-protein ligase TRIM22-like isoform X1 [Diceros bicornis minor]|uniref:E3 ubiquitin-protein ligase TRIM22-like isoform X1 n=1 Tax=Diceros bicornis minor TaxID=77932 RepID=UPI0026F174B5|nr:E3 ubiquitin-protein ligase TRIM22-like isoform X1 [Diceros bicornis minor]XP_058401780.1 E3 ubiquitin-protein ligase TRIM22-like isoform X1 [Diceros bicornis minor]XP_058401781.1 E3 ubiquitin-protein ligase TRIM22-like isoform X1 [Diceros bicornis minor]XP_058401782.1 E3 ubiquitin-protein ligase TRIM22-like isoform X1 [Diceros bicornis minor]XP_058401783.1 E3 ubiquitin-protein ligase TRIM22-like isoform X1 [Diceros bicornis minor]
MASGILVNIREEVTCPICLELLTKPVSLNCGHSFCQACITANNKRSIVSQEGENRCPICQFSYQPGNLQLNRSMANIVERLREVKLSPEEKQKGDICVRHEEKLLLFCKEDENVICWLCERSQEHHGHHTFLMEEIAQEYQEKLQAALEKLKEAQRESQKLEADFSEERTSWMNQIQNERQNVQGQFNVMRGILDWEEQKELLKLKNEEEDTLCNVMEAENELVQQSQLVRALISDVEHRLQGSTVEMLQDVNDIMKRTETLTLKKPKTFPKERRSVSRVSELREMLQAFKELADVRRYWVDVMLDPVNSISSIVVSPDKRQVTVLCPFTLRKKYPCDFSAFDVLGCQFFSKGKHYWEVDVSGKIAWIMGLCSKMRKLGGNKNSVFCFNPNVNDPNVYSRFRPLCGYWVIGLMNQSEYSAFEDSSTSCPQILSLSLAVPPRRVGVFLDCEAGTVSFFNVTDHGSLLYKFSNCNFSWIVFPYFNPLNCSGPIILCPPSS